MLIMSGVFVTFKDVAEKICALTLDAVPEY
jgi:hypothetical protein